jgi:hypothetical protein
MHSLFCKEWLLWKKKSDVIGKKMFHELCAGLSWRNLEMQIFEEVEYAICVQSVLQSLGEGSNTKSVHDTTEMNTSLA